VRWYLRYGQSYRDVEEQLAERGVTVDHVTVYRWVQTFRPEFIDAARHVPGSRWFVDENVCQGLRPLALPLPGGCSARSSHRRDGLEPAQRRGGTGVVHPRAASWFGAG
jgi:hypothetical protein